MMDSKIKNLKRQMHSKKQVKVNTSIKSNNQLGSPSNRHDVTRWSVNDVTRWLTSIDLHEYISAFRDNAITGDVLLEVGVDDLDYMNIKILAHRKIILKSIASLRNSSITHGDNIISESKPANSSSSTKVHWSNVKPLIEETPVNPASSAPVNLADGVYDEAAAHNDFLAAVNEWRNGTTKKSTLAGNESDTWTNPFLASPDTSSENNDFKLSSSSKTNDYSILNEEEEHKAFAAAVEEWRNGSKTAESSSCNTGTAMSPMRRKQNAPQTHNKRCCYQCYALISAETAYSNEGKSFCNSNSCFRRYQTEIDERRQTFNKRVQQLTTEESKQALDHKTTIEDDVNIEELDFDLAF